MNYSGYILAELEDIYGNNFIVPIAPTENPYYVTHDGEFTIDDLVDQIPYNKGEWVKCLFGLYIYEPTFNLLDQSEEIIDIVIGSKYVKVFTEVYYHAFREISSYFEVYRDNDIVDLDFETKLSLCVDIPNTSYSASRLFTNGDIYVDTSNYYNYILYMGRFFNLRSNGICEPTDEFKVGSTSRSFNERYREFYKGDSSLRKIERLHYENSYIKCVESFIIPPFIDTEATISSITRDSMRDESLDKRVIKDIFDGSKIKVRLDHIIYDSYYLAMCKLFHHKTLKFDKHGGKRSILDINSRRVLTKITEKYITFISNIMIKIMNNESISRRDSPVLNYIIKQAKNIQSNEEQSPFNMRLNIHNSHSDNDYSFNIRDISGSYNSFNSPLNVINSGVNVYQSRRPETVHEYDQMNNKKLNDYSAKLVFIIDTLLTASTSKRIIPIEVINRFTRLFCDNNRSFHNEHVVKDKIIDSLSKYSIRVD
jgi:hypothetical protein